MKAINLTVLLLTVLLLAVMSTVLFYSFYYVVDVKETHMKLMVAYFVGLDTNPVNLSFGAAPPGGAAYRQFIVRNIYSRPVTASITLSGDLAPMISLSGNSFVLKEGQQELITAIALVPEYAQPGYNYSGTLRVLYTRSW